MTLEQLEAYRANRAELEAVEDELNAREVTVAVSSAAEFPYSKHTATVSGLPPEPRVKALLERRARLRASCTAVERFAESIEDDEVRTVVRLRYMAQGRKPSWQDIALKLGYCAEHTPRRKLLDYIMHKTDG